MGKVHLIDCPNKDGTIRTFCERDLTPTQRAGVFTRPSFRRFGSDAPYNVRATLHEVEVTCKTCLKSKQRVFPRVL